MNFRFIRLSLVAFLTSVALSCSSSIDNEFNVDPNRPASVPVNAMLPQIEISIADLTGGNFSRFNSIITQQVEGIERQFSGFNQYSGLTPQQFDDMWVIMYERILIETDVMILKGQENGYNHYQAVGEVLKAYALMMATDVWGNIPFTEAGLGLDIPNPVYDNRTSVIYPAIFTLLDRAFSNLNKSNGGLALGSEDVIYGGNIDKWKKAVRAIRARAYLHRGNYSNALVEAQNSLESREDNIRFTYSEGSPGPWDRFIDRRAGDVRFHPFMENLMINLNDTLRLNVLSQKFVVGHPYFKKAFGQDLVSFREIKFIEAECLFRTGGSANDISQAYLAGIFASFEEVGLTTTDYENYISNSDINPGPNNIQLDEHILIQKYIGLFVQPEVFNDYRRTGIPELAPVSGNQVPVRWNYPSNELLFNSNAPGPSEADLFMPKIDWDF